MIRRKIFFGVCWAVAIGLAAAGFKLGGGISFEQQWPLFEALRNTASIIFAVVGAWLAIIYPERLKFSFGKRNGSVESSPGIGLLLTPAVHSTILLAILLLIGVAAPMVKQIPQAITHVELLRSVSFSALVGLTCWQIAIVTMTLIPAEVVQSSIDAEKARTEIGASRGRLRQ